ncbi:MAG: autotransporter assembly complex protein TamA [Bacteroidota bacterium]
MLRTAALLILALLTTIPSRPASAATRSLKVEVLGVSGALKRNVLLSLSIADKKRRKNATDEELRRLHARADDEIHRALQPYGYYRPTIQAELLTDGSWTAHYQIDPGPPILLDSVLVEVTGEGAADPKYQAIVRDFPLRKGTVLLQPAYEALKTSFQSAAAEGGFLDARFVTSRIDVDLQRYAAAIVLRYDTGPRHYFGSVSFAPDVIQDRMLHDFVDFHPGDVFDFRKLLQLQTDLSGTGYFTKVDVAPSTETSEHRVVPIDVSLAPAKKLRFTGGVGYGTDEGARVRLLTEMRRLNRAGHRASIELQYGSRDKRAIGQYFIPWPHPRTDVLTLASGYQDQRTATFHSKLFRSGISESRLLGKWRIVPALNYRRENYQVGVDSGTVRTLVPEGTWTRVRADDAVFTKNGDRLMLNARGANRGLVSDISFLQARGDAKLIHSFSSRTRGLARIEAGATQTGAFRRLPPTLRFFAGGTNSVRGYSYNSLGSRDELDHVIGGRYLLTGSLEMNQFFLPRWGAAVFLDAGDAMNSWRLSVKRGAGIGLRFLSPAGLVRADLAWGLDRRGTPLQVHLAMGSEL